jgi:glycosyltransferase involved in cell wall biosynthesis
VVIPCHNHHKWVQDALASIANQKYPQSNLRLMVVDDGSTDDSHLRVTEYMTTIGSDVVHPDGVQQICGTLQNMPLILMRRPKAGGPSVARNLGILVGNDGTDIFAFLDSDDTYDPFKIPRSVETFVKSEKIGAVYSDYTTLDENGLLIREYKEPFSRDRLMRECIVNCDSMVLKAAIDQCGGFDEEMRVCEDYDLWMRISERFVVSHIPESLVTIRVGSHSSTANVKPEIWQQNWRRITQKTQQRAASYGHR